MFLSFHLVRISIVQFNCLAVAYPQKQIHSFLSMNSLFFIASSLSWEQFTDYCNNFFKITQCIFSGLIKLYLKISFFDSMGILGFLL